MADRAIIGKPYVFQVLFLDGDAQPFLEAVPTIEVFSFNSEGEKVTYIDDVAMTASENEAGRYIYVFDVASDFSDGDIIYGQVRAINPFNDEVILGELIVNLASSSSSSSGSVSGLRAQFVKGG